MRLGFLSIDFSRTKGVSRVERGLAWTDKLAHTMDVMEVQRSMRIGSERTNEVRRLKKG
jgi:hypothetical protein